MNILYIIINVFCFLEMNAAQNDSEFKAKIKTSLKKNNSLLEISVIPVPGTVLNLEAPWRLTLRSKLSSFSSEEGKILNGDFDSSHFKQTEGIFLISAQEMTGVKSATLKLVPNINLTYFVCDNKKSWCKRFVYKN
jgi:hypothetical protein